MKQLILKLLNRFGYQLAKFPVTEAIPTDFPSDVVRIFQAVRPYTQTSPERINAVCESVRYLTSNGIEGDIVECGVWRGGSMMAAAKMLKELNSSDRRLYLFDTFEGMPPATSEDVDLHGVAGERLIQESIDATGENWNFASLGEVTENLYGTSYPKENITFVKGMIEDTLVANAPAKIALLRLDTDWYESTKHELEVLMPRMAKGGIVIIDDYGHFQGARKAVDEYIATYKPRIFLSRIDYTGRMFVCV